jgi:hypothetical protein
MAEARSLRISGSSRLALWRRVLINEGAQLCDELALLLYCERVLTWSAPNMTCMAPHTHETVAG